MADHHQQQHALWRGEDRRDEERRRCTVQAVLHLLMIRPAPGADLDEATVVALDGSIGNQAVTGLIRNLSTRGALFTFGRDVGSVLVLPRPLGRLVLHLSGFSVPGIDVVAEVMSATGRGLHLHFPADPLAREFVDMAILSRPPAGLAVGSPDLAARAS